MKFNLILSASVFLMFSTFIFGQTDANKKTLVSVPVTVSDREGRYIPGLKKNDFTLSVNGAEQKIESIGTFDEPLDIALLLDTSGSTKNSLTEIKAAAADFIELLNPRDRCQIATFDAQLKIIQTLTGDQKTLKTSLEKVVTAEKEGSIVLEAIDRTAQNAFPSTPNRKVVIVLSDGKDFGSSISKNELLSKLEEADVSIYTVFYQTGLGFNKLVVEADGSVKEGKPTESKKTKPPKKKKNYSILIPTRGDVFTEKDAQLIGKASDISAVKFLEEIADLTAGRFYQSDAPKLSGIFKKIAGELRQQYNINFYSRENFSENAMPAIIIKVKQSETVVRLRGKFRSKQL